MTDNKRQETVELEKAQASSMASIDEARKFLEADKRAREIEVAAQIQAILQRNRCELNVVIEYSAQGAVRREFKVVAL